jgi:glycosyltransferase involved in cell wall biosynthesis
MKILLLGDFRGSSYDEGYRNVALHFAGTLSSKNEVKQLDISRLTSLLSVHHLREVVRFKPQIIHIFTAPTIRSFVLLRLTRMLCPESKGVMSALHPDGLHLLNHPVITHLLYFLRPHCILVQSGTTARFLTERGFSLQMFPNGVDLDKFVPVSAEEKSRLREFYQIDKHAFVMLHVGHLKENRGLQACILLQKSIPDSQMVLVGSPHFPANPDLADSLSRAGCITFTQYFPHIEELYQMADCYIFPRGTAILMPLSIMEAMACNLPVITYPFESLSSFIPEAEGLTFAADLDELLQAVNRRRYTPGPVSTRESILSYSWKRLGDTLGNLYTSLIR